MLPILMEILTNSWKVGKKISKDWIVCLMNVKRTNQDLLKVEFYILLPKY